MNLYDSLFRAGVPMIFSAVTCLSLGYLASVRRDQFVRYWTGAWALLMLRYTWNLLSPTHPPLWSEAVSEWFRLLFGLAVIGGVLRLRDHKVSRALQSAAAGTVLAGLLASKLLVGGWAASLMAELAVSVSVALAAWLLATFPRLPGFERGATAVALVAYAALSGASVQLDDRSPLFLSVTAASWAAEVTVAVCMLSVFFRLSYEAELERQRQVGTALAEVLGEYLPICMWCKAIRDDDDVWHKLEQYVAARSTIQFTHGLCPDCAMEHYGMDIPAK